MIIMEAMIKIVQSHDILTLLIKNLKLITIFSLYY